MLIHSVLVICFLIPIIRGLDDNPCWSNSPNKFIWGNALVTMNCTGPHGQPYPKPEIDQLVLKFRLWSKQMSSWHAEVDGDLLTKWMTWRELPTRAISKRQTVDNAGYSQRCPESEQRLCPSHMNTTAPLYGRSMTSGRVVIIVQKFPEFLQQVVYEVCQSSSCRMVRGRCVQAYAPQLFLTFPFGPVTYVGQDYVLVESACICKASCIAK